MNVQQFIVILFEYYTVFVKCWFKCFFDGITYLYIVDVFSGIRNERVYYPIEFYCILCPRTFLPQSMPDDAIGFVWFVFDCFHERGKAGAVPMRLRALLKMLHGR